MRERGLEPPRDFTPTSTSSWRVCQFRHSRSGEAAEDTTSAMAKPCRSLWQRRGRHDDRHGRGEQSLCEIGQERAGQESLPGRGGRQGAPLEVLQNQKRSVWGCQLEDPNQVVIDVRVERQPAIQLFEKFGFYLSRIREQDGRRTLDFFVDLYSDPRPG